MYPLSNQAKTHNRQHVDSEQDCQKWHPRRGEGMPSPSLREASLGRQRRENFTAGMVSPLEPSVPTQTTLMPGDGFHLVVRVRLFQQHGLSVAASLNCTHSEEARAHPRDQVQETPLGENRKELHKQDCRRSARHQQLLNLSVAASLNCTHSEEARAHPRDQVQETPLGENRKELHKQDCRRSARHQQLLNPVLREP